MPASANLQKFRSLKDSPIAWAKGVRVPCVLVEIRPVHSSHSIIDTVYAELIGPYPDDWAEALMGFVSCTVLAVVPFVDDGPEIRERRYEMAIGDSCELREVSELHSLQQPQRPNTHSSCEDDSEHLLCEE